MRNRNIETLVHHINNQCPSATNKYNKKGQLKKASNKINSCNWKSATSPSELTQEDLENMEFENLLFAEQKRDDYQISTPFKQTVKKRKLNAIDAENKYQLNNRDIRTYCNGPTPMTVSEKECAHKSWALFFAVCDVPIQLIEHPLFLNAVRLLCSTYKPPSATCIKDRYINELVEDDTALLRTELDDEKIWVSADGSENNAKETVIHILATGSFGTRLIDQIYHKPGTKITAERIHRDLIDCRERIIYLLNVKLQ